MTTGSANVADDVLHAVLREAVRRAAGNDVAILSIRREPWAYGSTHRLDSLELALDDGTRFELLAKSHVKDAKGTPGADARDPGREVVAYSTFLRSGDTGAPAFYGAIRDSASTTLLLERIHGCELYQTGDMEAWLAASRWLAAFHDRFADRAPPQGLLTRNEHWWRSRWRRAIDVAGDEAGRLRSLERAHDAAVRRLLRSSATLVHGEFYPANVMIQTVRGAQRARPVDWEMTGHGPALLDLAALTAGRWNEAQREAMIDVYRRATKRPSAFGDDREFSRALAAARLLLAIQWLGWAEDWTPPGDQACDWLAEAERAAASD